MPSVQSRSPWRSHFVEHTFSDQLIITAYMVSVVFILKRQNLTVTVSYMLLYGQYILKRQKSTLLYLICSYKVSSSWRGKTWQLLYLILAGQSLQVLHCTFKSEKKARRWKHHLIKLFTGIQSCIINVNCPEIWVQKSPLKWVNRDCFCDIMQLCWHFGHSSFILTQIFFFSTLYCIDLDTVRKAARLAV